MSWVSRPDRLWMLGGVFAAAALLALAWVFLIGPQRTETEELATSTEDVRVQVTTEQRLLARLTKENEQKASYEADLATNRKALPTEVALADLLRELQAAGDQAGVTVTGLAAGSPVDAKVPESRIFAVTVTINAEGSMDKLQAFVTQLQQTQPRALLILNANLSPGTGDSGLTGAAKLALSAQVFVAPQAAEPAAESPAASGGTGTPATTD
jgi:Tfp pilus assembly protein PilO